jgi:ATP-dependent DNA ligase
LDGDLEYAKQRGVDTLVEKESTMKPAKKRMRKLPKSTTATGKEPTGFTDEERAAMRERLQELKADARRGRRPGKADGQSAVLAKIAALPQPDRAIRLLKVFL